jgi:hypothetical protein
MSPLRPSLSTSGQFENIAAKINHFIFTTDTWPNYFSLVLPFLTKRTTCIRIIAFIQFYQISVLFSISDKSDYLSNNRKRFLSHLLK